MKRKGSVRARNDGPRSDFQQQAEQTAPNILWEFLDFVLHNKKWWLIPIVVSLLLLGLLVLFSGSGVAPFIYTLF